MESTAKAKKSAWEDQKKQIELDKQEVIKTTKQAIDLETKDGKNKLKELNTSIEKTEKSYNSILLNSTNEKTRLRREIEDLQRDKKVLIQTNTDLTQENRELSSTITVNKKEVKSLEEDETALKESINTLTDDKKDLEETVKGLNDVIERKTTEFETLKDDFDTKKEQFDKDISMLEVKKKDLSQEILNNRAEDDKVRDNLALWEGKLNDREKNLRIREAQATEKENRIIRNHDLLNM